MKLGLTNGGLSEYVDKVVKEKPPALVYIDDRAIRYDPLCTNLLDQIINFKPDNKIESDYDSLNELLLLVELNSKKKQFEEANKAFDKKFGNKDEMSLQQLKQAMIINIKLMDDWIASVKKYL